MSLQDIKKKMERRIGPLKSPTLLTSLKEYPTYCSFALCAVIYMFYGELKRLHEWYALITVHLKADTASEGTSEQTKLSNGRKYFKCGLDYHLKNSLDFPDRNKDHSKEHNTNTTSDSGYTRTTSD